MTACDSAAKELVKERRDSMKAKGSPWPGWRPWIASKGCDVVTDPISRRRMPGERYVECRFCRELIHARDLPPGGSVEEPPDACPACGREE